MGLGAALNPESLGETLNPDAFQGRQRRRGVYNEQVVETSRDREDSPTTMTCGGVEVE